MSCNVTVTQTVKITNPRGLEATGIDTVLFSLPGFAQDTSSAQGVLPDSTDTLKIICSATHNGVITGTMTIKSNATDSPSIVIVLTTDVSGASILANSQLTGKPQIVSRAGILALTLPGYVGEGSLISPSGRKIFAAPAVGSLSISTANIAPDIYCLRAGSYVRMVSIIR